MIITKEYLKLIKPKKSRQSDKFSWNIYRYLRTYLKFKNVDVKVLDTSFGVIFCYHIEPAFYNGRSIRTILQAGSYGSLQNYAYVRRQEQYKDISEEFFKWYPILGRCYFDKEHNGWWVGEEHRYTTINKHCLRCNWCGAFLKRRIETKVKRVREEHWEIQNPYERVIGFSKEKKDSKQ